MEHQSPPPPLHHLPPSKVPRLSESLTCGILTVAASPDPPPLALGLELGLGPGKSSFTFLQLQELRHQALIYKYMVSGLPIPFHLVLPIWKSVAGSGSPSCSVYPRFMGCSSMCFDYRNFMEPEPGRCRRTDGKKWRCSRDVVPEQKYCERHMHRGRHRSRKPVEVAAAATATATATATISSSSSNGDVSIRSSTGGSPPVNITTMRSD